MRLRVYTDFSLCVLMFLALKDDGLATIAEVAKAYGISKNHLMKVAYQLGLAGYVKTVRGKGGGLRLARRPEDVVIGEVVRRTEPDMTLVPCFAPDDGSCAIFPSCAVRFPRRAMRSFRRSTSTPWRTLPVRAHHCGNCCPSIQTTERRHKSCGLAGGCSHVANARSNTWRPSSKTHRDRVGSVSSHIARESGQIEDYEIGRRFFRCGNSRMARRGATLESVLGLWSYHKHRDCHPLRRYTF